MNPGRYSHLSRFVIVRPGLLRRRGARRRRARGWIMIVEWQSLPKQRPVVREPIATTEAQDTRTRPPRSRCRTSRRLLIRTYQLLQIPCADSPHERKRAGCTSFEANCRRCVCHYVLVTAIYYDNQNKGMCTTGFGIDRMCFQDIVMRNQQS